MPAPAAPRHRAAPAPRPPHRFGERFGVDDRHSRRQRRADQRTRFANGDHGPAMCRSGTARSCKSPPLNLPPTIATTDEKLSIERAAASTLVAFESLTKRTPSTVATGSITCSSPLNPSSARTSPRRRRRQATKSRSRRRRCSGGAGREADRAQRHQRDVAVRGPLPDRTPDPRTRAHPRWRRAHSGPAAPASLAPDPSPPRCRRSPPSSRRGSGSRRRAAWPPRKRPRDGWRSR